MKRGWTSEIVATARGLLYVGFFGAILVAWLLAVIMTGCLRGLYESHLGRD